MWISGQQKRAAQAEGSRTGTVTMSGGELAVETDGERRGLEIYGPAGYCWTPRVGQRVLVVQSGGEAPCVAGARQGEMPPDRVVLEAGCLELRGQVKINGVPLDGYIAGKVAELMETAEGTQ